MKTKWKGISIILKAEDFYDKNWVEFLGVEPEDITNAIIEAD